MHRLIRISKMCDFNCQTGRRKCDGLRLLCSVQGWSFVQTERHLKATQHGILQNHAVIWYLAAGYQKQNTKLCQKKKT